MNDALDGELTAAEVAAVEAHVLTCAPCRDEYARLSEIVEAVRTLPRQAESPDVWESIALRISDPARDRAPDVGAGVKVLALPGGADVRAPRRISFSVPQLAAAAVLVSLLSGSVALLMTSGPVDSPQVAERTPALLQGAAARAVSSEGNRYGEVVLQLEQIVAEGRAVLAPETLATIESSLTTVNDAIADVEQALADDPGSDLLLRMLANYQRTKLGVLQRAAAAVQAQT